TPERYFAAIGPFWSRGVWQVPHPSTESTRYLPRATLAAEASGRGASTGGASMTRGASATIGASAGPASEELQAASQHPTDPTKTAKMRWRDMPRPPLPP